MSLLVPADVFIWRCLVPLGCFYSALNGSKRKWQMSMQVCACFITLSVDDSCRHSSLVCWGGGVFQGFFFNVHIFNILVLKFTTYCIYFNQFLILHNIKRSISSLFYLKLTCAQTELPWRKFAECLQNQRFEFEEVQPFPKTLQTFWFHPIIWPQMNRTRWVVLLPGFLFLPAGLCLAGFHRLISFHFPVFLCLYCVVLFDLAKWIWHICTNAGCH